MVVGNLIAVAHDSGSCAFYEIDLECVKKKKQCAQTVHPEKKTDRINFRNMKDKDNIRQHE